MGRLNKSFALFSTVLFLLALVTVLISPLKAMDSWNIQGVGSANIATSVIAVGSNSNPHIAYSAFENDSHSNPSDVMYASWNTSSWRVQALTQGWTDDFVLDSNNDPHIIYHNKTGNLLYMNYDGNNWSTKQVANDGSEASLKLDSNGNPEIAYVTYSALKYAVWKDSAWYIQTIDSSGFFLNPSLALDSNNNPHILYGLNQNQPNNPQSTEDIKYASYDGSVWNIQTIVAGVDQGFGNLVLDSKGYPHFTYAKGNPQFTSNQVTLTYMSWNGSSWNSLAVASNVRWHGGGWVALDSNDYPNVLYVLLSESDLEVLTFAEWIGNEWATQNVTNSGFVGVSSLAIDSGGNPHVSFLVPTSGYGTYLYYATERPEDKQPISQDYTITVSIVLVTGVLISTFAFLAYRRHRKPLT